MLKYSLHTLLKTWGAGWLALLPLLLTLALITWAISLLNRFIGPASLIGQLFQAMGAPFAHNAYLAYFFGTLLLFGLVFLLGLGVRTGLKGPLVKLINRTLHGMPLFGRLYSLADRFVGLLDQKESTDIAAMSPVWCFFGGDGVGVLALMPNPEPVSLNGKDYYAVLVPTAPVPFGGGLLYVPGDWVQPANIGVEKLTSIYVSMGLTPPPSIPAHAITAAPSNEPTQQK